MLRRWGPFLVAWAIEGVVFYWFVRINLISTPEGRLVNCVFLAAVLFFNAFVVSPFRKKPLV